MTKEEYERAVEAAQDRVDLHIAVVSDRALIHAHDENERLKGLLKPFADAAEFVSDHDDGDLLDECYLARSEITAGDLRRAALGVTGDSLAPFTPSRDGGWY